MSVGGPHASDEELVEQSLASRTEAFAELYQRHRERVYRIAYRFARNKADALDLCQEVFVKVYESLSTFKGQARFSTWLTRIAANTCVDHCRHAQTRRSSELDTESVNGDFRLPGHKVGPAPSEGAEREELRVAIGAAVAQLSPEHREVFVLHTVEGLTYEEIADAVGCPIGTVMSRLHYARKRLRGLLEWLNKD
ncbi:MAG TPA: RNA polymerase sigma factor [Planctomycetota bacterium]|nr:RNA polymerase sigma factor [Planctomycetota bacterium]